MDRRLTYLVLGFVAFPVTLWTLYKVKNIGERIKYLYFSRNVSNDLWMCYRSQAEEDKAVREKAQEPKARLVGIF